MGGGNESPLSVALDDDDGRYLRFGLEVGKRGFTQTERLIPGGFPTPTGNVVVRYRSAEPTAEGSLYQLGPGVFSANGLPPYQSWESFRPVVAHGIADLFAAEPSAMSTDLRLELRYIDAFHGQLLAGKQPLEFIRDILCIPIDAPGAVRRHASGGDTRTLRFGITMPRRDGAVALEVGQGKFAQKDAVILTTIVRQSARDLTSPDAIITRYDEAQMVLSDMFAEMTHQIRDLMMPSEPTP